MGATASGVSLSLSTCPDATTGASGGTPPAA
jgi:hypothetical protein